MYSTAVYVIGRHRVCEEAMGKLFSMKRLDNSFHTAKLYDGVFL
jgi:hypothetical protein